MKNDAREFAALAQTPATPRFDLYGVIHKAIRAMMADSLMAVGSTDVTDPTRRRALAAQVEELLDFCHAHLEHENLYLHPAIEARASGASERIAQEHEEHRAHIAALRRGNAVLREAPDAAAALAAAGALYRELALFVADNFAHMHVEETAHNAVLWSRYTDAELVEIHNALVASIPPAEMALALRWMLPSMNHAERVAVLADMRASAPPPAFEGTLALARSHLADGDWAALTQALALPHPAG